MIFPNRAPAPELRPGMGFTPGAEGFEGFGYQGGSHAMLSEAAHMGYAAGSYGTLGSFSANMEANALQAGVCQQSDLDLLNSLGATDQDLANLMAGIVTLQQLYAQYGVTFDSSTSTSAPAAGQIPSGSTLLYTCTVNTPPLTSAQDIINAIAPELPSHGMAIVTSQVSKQGSVSGPASFSVTVMDSVGHALKSDAQSIMDGLVENYLGSGNLQLQSSLSVVSPGTTATGQPGTPASFVTWLENNAVYIGAGVLALVLVNNFTGGKRR